jgi:hypothetical protein
VPQYNDVQLGHYDHKVNLKLSTIYVNLEALALAMEATMRKRQRQPYRRRSIGRRHRATVHTGHGSQNDLLA